MILTGTIQIDTDIMAPERFAEGLDLELAQLRRDMVKLYVEQRAGEAETA